MCKTKIKLQIINIMLLIKVVRKSFFYLKRVKEVKVSRSKTSFQKANYSILIILYSSL